MKTTLQRWASTARARLDQIQCQARACFGAPALNLDSPAELRSLLYDQLQLDHGLSIARTATGAKSTDEAALNSVFAATAHALPRLVLEHRRLRKFTSTFIDGMLAGLGSAARSDGRVRTSVLQTGTATGRLATERPNLQNIPREVFDVVVTRESRLIGKTSRTESITINPRAAITAPDASTVLLSCDYAQIELRLLLHFCDEPKLQRVLAQHSGGDGGGVFAAVAALWLKADSQPSTPQLTPDDLHRRCKRIMYAAIYGVGAERLAEQLGPGTTKAEALRMLGSFSRAFPTIDQFRRTVLASCRKLKYVETLIGRRRYFPGIGSTVAAVRSASERQAFNFVLQGSAADVCKIAMVRCHERLTRLDNLSPAPVLIMQVHDELLFEVPARVLQQTAAAIQLAMEMAVRLRVPLKVSISTGRTWGDMERLVLPRASEVLAEPMALAPLELGLAAGTAWP